MTCVFMADCVIILQPLYMHVAFQAPQIDDVDTVCVRGGDSQKIPNDYWREIPSSVTDNARRCYLGMSELA